MMTKYLAWFAYCAVVVHLLAQQGYYGVAVMMAKDCTVVALNPFRLDLR